MSKFTVFKKNLKILKEDYGQLYFGKVYRFMKMDGIIPSLENSTLRYKASKEFNDPLDCSNRTIDLKCYLSDFYKRRSKEKLATAIVLHFLKRFKSFSKEKETVDSLINMISSDDFKNEIKSNPACDEFINSLNSYILKKPEYFIKEMDFGFKFCCLSTTYNSAKSFLMWSHYADSHKGACLEFDFAKRLEDFLGKHKDLPKEINDQIALDFDRDTVPFIVKYVKKIPTFKFDETEKDLFTWFTTKSKIWEYEEEVRCILGPSNTESFDEMTQRVTNTPLEDLKPVYQSYEDVNFPFKYLTKVIFGNLTPDEEINKIKSIVKEKYPENNVCFEKMEVDPNSFNLFPKRISEPI